jgi:hypothetical protein
MGVTTYTGCECCFEDGSGDCCQVCDPASDPPNCIKITFSDMVGPQWGDPPPCANAPGPVGPGCTDPANVSFSYLNGLFFKLWRRPKTGFPGPNPITPTCHAEPEDCPECSGGIYLTNCCPAGPPCLVGDCGPTKRWYLCGKGWCSDLPPLVCQDIPDPYFDYEPCGTRCTTDPACVGGDLPDLCADEVTACDVQDEDATGVIELSTHLSARCVIPAACGGGDPSAPATAGILPDVTFSVFVSNVTSAAAGGTIFVGGSTTFKLSRCAVPDSGEFPTGTVPVQATAPAPTCAGGAFLSQLWTFDYSFTYGPEFGGMTLTFSGKILVEAVAC